MCNLQVRLFSVLFNHLVIRRSRRVDFAQRGALAIFDPIVTNSRCPLLECDINGHKSNSTFYSDLDINRIHLILTLFKTVLYPSLNSSNVGKGGVAGGRDDGQLRLALGGVSCTFRKEILPYERYEIWSRVLSWDEKWVYIASNFVRTNARRRGGAAAPKKDESVSATTNKSPVLGSAITKYVFKSGRRTIPPEQVFRRHLGLELLPSEPGWGPHQSARLGGSKATCAMYAHTNGIAHETLQPSASTLNHSSEPTAPTGSGAGMAGWAEVQEERIKGLKLAHHFASLDGLCDTFEAASSEPLAVFSDL